MKNFISVITDCLLVNSKRSPKGAIIPQNSINFNNYFLNNTQRYFAVSSDRISVYTSTNDSTSSANSSNNIINECTTVEHQIVDIMDDKSVSSIAVLSTPEFLSTKRTNLINKQQFDNLKPHEVKKFVSSKQDEYYTFDKSNIASPNEITLPKYDHLVDKSILTSKSQTNDTLKRNETENKLHFQNQKIYNKSSEDYYKTFFKDRERIFDGLNNEISSIQNNILNNETKKSRTRVSPLKYWINPNYQSPEINDIMNLNSFDLKFVMMNEAKLYSNGHTVNQEVWDSLIDRALGMHKVPNIRTLLRFLHSISIPRISNPKVKNLIDLIYKKKYEMKPKHYVFLFQALSRLKIRDHRICDDLYEMILCWPVLRNNFLIKATNSLSKLGLADNILINPLKEVFKNRIQELSGRECKRIKPITVMELFTDDMIVEFLNRCEYNKNYFTDSIRNLFLIELYLRLLKPDVYDNLSKSTKKFLNSLREYGNINDELVMKRRKCDAPMTAEHEDISRILSILNVKHQNCIPAGQITLDIYEGYTNTVIEINNKYQYYDGTTQLTSLAKRRHDLISAMGFRLFHIPYRWWNMLESDENKIDHIKKMFINL